MRQYIPHWLIDWAEPQKVLICFDCTTQLASFIYDIAGHDFMQKGCVISLEW
jgi:hypothetical protein